MHMEITFSNKSKTAGTFLVTLYLHNKWQNITVDSAVALLVLFNSYSLQPMYQNPLLIYSLES